MGLGAVSLVDHLPENSGETIVVFVAEGNEAKRLQLGGRSSHGTHQLYESADGAGFRSHMKFCQSAFANSAGKLGKSASG